MLCCFIIINKFHTRGKKMDYKSLNLKNRAKMNSHKTNDLYMAWEDSDLIKILSRKLPELDYTRNKDVDFYEIQSLEKFYNSFKFPETNRKAFINELNLLIKPIHEKIPSWQGLNIHTIDRILRLRKSCLLFGVGGIGKSYFVSELEKILDIKGIEHLCIYGKEMLTTDEIDYNEIKEVAADKEFYFIIDALNEFNDDEKRKLLQNLKQLIHLNGLRVLITYRTGRMDSEILEQYSNLAEYKHEFRGVSFESALEYLSKASVPDAYKYESILYSNNPLLLSMLCTILQDPKLINENRLENITSITFIFERYIDKTAGPWYWKQTKSIATWMYNNDSRSIPYNELSSLVEDVSLYICDMQMHGFLTSFTYDGITNYAFSIESLADFLIARQLFNDLGEKELDTQIGIICKKLKNNPGLEEAFILLVFDKYKTDYKKIKYILTQTSLSDYFTFDVLVKINFAPINISEFINTFTPIDSSELLVSIGGYNNKPFNCVNYLNRYYLQNKEKQMYELSKTLGKRYGLDNLKGRLKNIIYYITLTNNNSFYFEEPFYFSLWCSAAPNQDVRCLAIKCLYEITIRNEIYIDKLIDVYPDISDFYIKEAIIEVLSSFSLKSYPSINTFFRLLISDKKFTLSKSLYKISKSTNTLYKYINWEKENYFKESDVNTVSDILNEIFIRIDIYNKNILPFRYWGKNHFEINNQFILENKEKISEWNTFLSKTFDCVRNGGYCNSLLAFPQKASQLYSVDYSNKCIKNTDFLCSLEAVIKEIFSMYGVSYDDKLSYLNDHILFSNSLFLKCINISIDKFYGSLMCNYYTSSFATYNSAQNIIGYEVYDPLEYKQDFFITSPVPTHNRAIEKLGDLLVKRFESPCIKNNVWANDVTQIEKNLLLFGEPINYKNNQWVVIGCRISLSQNNDEKRKWRDNYNYWCCTSNDITINGNHDDRYYTIELDEYNNNIDLYKNCSQKPHLCKSVRNIKYGSKVFEETSLVLPPAKLINDLQLVPSYTDMSWVNNKNEKIILCNNTKNSYYSDPIGSTIFMRKDVFDKYAQKHTLKFFAFTERYTLETGYTNNSSMHFEIQSNVIVKKYSNYNPPTPSFHKDNPCCTNCIYEFYKPVSSDDVLENLLKNFDSDILQ